MAADETDRTEKTIRARQTVRVVSVLAIVAVLALWAFANTDETEVDWLVTSTEGPLVVVIAISAVLGFVLGAIASWRGRR